MVASLCRPKRTGFLRPAWGLALLLLLGACNNLLYHPDTRRPETTCAQELAFEEISLTASDGVEIYGWYRPAQDQSLPTLAYFHGNAGNLGRRACVVRPYVEAGLGVFILSYRGYGGSAGRPSEEGFYRDGRTALDYLTGAAEVRADRLVLYGVSLGTGVAVQMATEHDSGAVVLLAPFTSAPDAARAIVPLFPFPMTVIITESYASLDKIDSIDAPLLIIHGAEDGIVPVDQGQTLFERAEQPKALQIIPKAGHNDLDGRSHHGTSARCRALETLDEHCAEFWVLRFLRQHLSGAKDK